MRIHVTVDDREYIFDPLSETHPTNLTTGERIIVAAALRHAADLAENGVVMA